MNKIRTSKKLVALWVLVWLLWTPVSTQEHVDSLQYHLDQHFPSYDLPDLDVYPDGSKVKTPGAEVQVRNLLHGAAPGSTDFLEVYFTGGVARVIRGQHSPDWECLLFVFLFPFHVFL